MEKLVPTLRTDKNGRTQIRHLRSDEAPGGGSSIPGPILGVQGKPARLSNEQVFDLLKGAGYSYVGRRSADRALDELRMDDPELVPLVAQLAAAGPTRASEQLFERLDEIIEEVMGAIREAEKDAEKYDDSAGWGEYSDGAAWPHGRSNLIMAYHLGCVIAEVEASGAAVGHYRPHNTGVEHVHFLLRGKDPAFNSEALDHEADAARCRGTAAYVLAGLDKGLTSRDADCRAAGDFIEWAAQQDDIAEVVVAAQQAGTSDTASLTHLIGERQRVEPALRGGAL